MRSEALDASEILLLTNRQYAAQINSIVKWRLTTHADQAILCYLANSQFQQFASFWAYYFLYSVFG
jgi:hypothetical protein